LRGDLVFGIYGAVNPFFPFFRLRENGHDCSIETQKSFLGKRKKVYMDLWLFNSNELEKIQQPYKFDAKVLVISLKEAEFIEFSDVTKLLCP
jgi:hypothetical protein